MMRELPPGGARRIPASQHEGVGGKGLRRGHVFAGDFTSGGSSLVGGVGHSASTGLAGAGGRSRYRRASRRWMDQYPYRVGWSRGCNESERSDGPSARRLRYSRDVVFNALGAWTSRLPGRPNSPPYRTSREELTQGIRAPFQGWMQADSATETTLFRNGKGRYLGIADMMPEAQNFLSFSSSHFFAHTSSSHPCHAPSRPLPDTNSF